MENLNIFAVLLSFALVLLLIRDSYAEEERLWQTFKEKHRKKYHCADHENHRRSIWKRSRNYIKRHNDEYVKGMHTYKLDENELADLSETEIQALKSSFVPQNVAEKTLLTTPFVATTRQGLRQSLSPSQLDLRNHSCMPAIKNQLKCGSCYAYAAVHPIEFQYCLKTGVRYSFSEQQIVDCSASSPYNNKGCAGGWYGNAWNYLTSTGISFSSDYPYTNNNGTCKTGVRKVATMNSWKYVTSLDETEMAKTLATVGPLTVAMNCTKNFDYYKSGVFSDSLCVNTYSSTTVNHAMNIVGYGTDRTTGLAYWIVRNTWGTFWGIQGFVLVQRGVNMCNIARYPAYATI